MISYPHVFELDGSTYMAYLGNQVGRYGFGLAVLGRNAGVGPTAMRWNKLGQDFRPDAAQTAERLRAVRPVAAGAGI